MTELIHSIDRYGRNSDESVDIYRAVENELTGNMLQSVQPISFDSYRSFKNSHQLLMEAKETFHKRTVSGNIELDGADLLANGVHYLLAAATVYTPRPADVAGGLQHIMYKYLVQQPAYYDKAEERICGVVAEASFAFSVLSPSIFDPCKLLLFRPSVNDDVHQGVDFIVSTDNDEAAEAFNIQVKATGFKNLAKQKKEGTILFRVPTYRLPTEQDRSWYQFPPRPHIVHEIRQRVFSLFDRLPYNPTPA